MEFRLHRSCSYIQWHPHTRGSFLNLVNSELIRFVVALFRLIHPQMEFRLVQDQSEECDCSPGLGWSFSGLISSCVLPHGYISRVELKSICLVNMQAIIWFSRIICFLMHIQIFIRTTHLEYIIRNIYHSNNERLIYLRR